MNPLSPQRFCELYPHVYHMAHADSWAGIRRHGLLSTTALLDLFGINGDQRLALESKHRPESIVIEHPERGRAVIRDQKPMSDGALRKCLRGMSIESWYNTLNGKVFFWLDEERLGRLLRARAYRNSAHCVLTVDSGLLIKRHLDRITLSPINSGSTIFNPQPRGPETFLSLDQFPFEKWSKKRGARKAVAELAVAYGVPDIVSITLRAELVTGDRTVELIHERGS